MKNRFIRIAILITCFVIIIYTGLISYVLWDMRDIEVAFDISPTTYLTDELAVDLSKKALIKATGRAEDSFSPEYFHSKKEGYFARNANYPDHGYVLWFDKNSNSKSSLYHYSVSLERRGNMIIASVGKAK